MDLFLAVQAFGATQAPPQLSLRVWTYPNVFGVWGAFWGTHSDFLAAIAPLLAKLPQNAKLSFEQGDWLASLRSFYDGAQLPQPEAYQQRETFFAKSVVAPGELTAAALRSFFGSLSSRAARDAPVAWWVMLDLYGGTGSAIAAFPPAWSSYAHRNALWTVQLYAHTADHLPPFPDAAIPLMHAMLRSLTDAQPETVFGAYPNYADPTLPAAEAHQRYYGGQLQRLAEIKRQADPEERFWHPQAIAAADGV